VARRGKSGPAGDDLDGLNEWLPALAYLYGLHPWHIEQLTLDQLQAYCEHATDFIGGG
jgi:hypothetical protein